VRVFNTDKLIYRLAFLREQYGERFCIFQNYAITARDQEYEQYEATQAHWCPDVRLDAFLYCDSPSSP